jgi:ribose 5-phosphate isomerase
MLLGDEVCNADGGLRAVRGDYVGAGTGKLLSFVIWEVGEKGDQKQLGKVPSSEEILSGEKRWDVGDVQGLLDVGLG